MFRLLALRTACVVALAAQPTMSGAAEESTASKRAMPIDPAARMADLPPAVIDDSLAIGGEDIAAHKIRTRMTVNVLVNGTGPYRFVVDSGADTSVVGRRVANALELPAGTPVLLNGITASSYVDRVRVNQLEVGRNSIYDLHLPVLKEFDLGADGMLGLDALVEQRLMIDFETRTISVGDALAPAPRWNGEIVVTAQLKRGQLILTEVKAGKTAVDAVIDTGSEITIGNSALRDQLFSRYPDDFETVQVTGVTGIKSDLQLVRVPVLKVGSITLRDVPIAFADVPPFQVFGIDQKPSLLLGTDLMEAFRRVSLDFRARKVRFQLRKCDRARIRFNSTPTIITRMESDNLSTCIR